MHHPSKRPSPLDVPIIVDAIVDVRRRGQVNRSSVLRGAFACLRLPPGSSVGRLRWISMSVGELRRT